MRIFEDFWSDRTEAEEFHLCWQDGYNKSLGTIAGAYSLTSTAAVTATIGASECEILVPSEVLVDGTINPNQTIYYAVNLTAGETYLFSLYGSGENPLADTFLYLFDHTGSLIDYDDDGGAGINSLLTFTASATGTYYIGAGAYPGAGLSGDFTLDLVQAPGIDEVSDTFEDATPLTIGGVTYGFIEAGVPPVYSGLGDVDTYSFTAEAGTVITIEIAGGADYNSDYTALPDGELDTVAFIYDSYGNRLTFNDDIDFPDDVSSRVSFIVPETGTYYLDVTSYTPWTGGYSITSSVVSLADLDPLDAINWVNAANVPFDETNTAYVYFGAAGENFGETGPSYGWNDYEIQQVMAALEQYEIILGVNYEITDDVDQATFRLFTTTSTQFGAYFYPQDPGYGTQMGIGAFNINSGGWSYDEQQSLVQGGFSFGVILHEFGHAHGLAHPHDTGGGSDVMLGVAGSSSTGIFDLNQGVYTVMSYVDGWELHPDGPYNLTGPNVDHGWSGSLSAFDIAVLQQRYGVHEYATGDDVYTLADVNEQGTFYSTIWDSAGVDTILYDGDKDAQIDLLAATLDYSPTGGGAISFVHDIFGGYTIANGVVIENATGGSGDDILLGNDADNVLTGNAGSDMLMGRGGDDIFVLDGLFTGDGVDTVLDFELQDFLLLQNVSGMAIVFEQDGADTIVSFDGTEVAVIENSSAAAALAGVVFADTPASASLIIDGSTIPVVIGSDGSDKLKISNKAASVLFGGDGNDDLTGHNGDDIIIGNAGNDYLRGSNGDDTLFGGEGNDTLVGNNGDDTLIGGQGNDVLIGGNGNNILTGGSGSDTFTFDIPGKNSGYDIVTDYNTLEDSIAFTSGSPLVSFMDGASGAEMYANGTLTAIFEGLTAADMVGEYASAAAFSTLDSTMGMRFVAENMV